MSTNFPTGLDSFTNPSPTDKLNGDPNPLLLHSSQHANLNDAVTAVEVKLGINFSSNSSTVDYLVKNLSTIMLQPQLAGYKEVTGGAFPTNVAWYTTAAKTIKLAEKNITYSPGTVLVTQIEYKLYDGTISNVLKRTITDVITLSGPFEVSRTRTVS